MPFRVAILTVSDSASKDDTVDKSGPLAREIVEAKGYIFVESRIVADDEKTIRHIVKQWCHSGGIDFVITTGGTGFGVRDRTPEAVKSLLEREAPGIVHLLLGSSLAHTPLAALSRPVAGTIRNSLVITLPGSPKAVRENLSALFDAGVLNHALDLVKGGSGKGVHDELQGSPSTYLPSVPGLSPTSRSTQQPYDHSHHHHHHHDEGHSIPQPRTVFVHDANFPASTRSRVSPYPLISYEQAMSTIFRETRVLEIENRRVDVNLRGTVLAENVYAPHDIPSTRTTNVDGYALRSTDPPGTYQVLTAQTHTVTDVVPAGCIFRINTGAPLPAGTDSVIMVEDTQLVTATTDGTDEEIEVRTLAQVAPGENTRAPGSDARQGELALQKNIILSGTGGEIGTLVFVGCKEVSVYRKPVVAVMSTGNELIDIQGSPFVENVQEPSEKWGGIFDTNRPSLQAALITLGYQVIDLGIVKDDLQSHADSLREGLQRADIVITTGGTSMGASDLLKPVIERHLNGTIHFGRVTIKPGKPTTFATIPHNIFGEQSHKLTKPIFALPGNPASALVCFNVFVLPALRYMGGWPKDRCQLPRVSVKLNSDMPLDPRTEFHRVLVTTGSEGLLATSTGGQRSSRIASLSGANGLVILPQKMDGGPKEVKAGQNAVAIMISEIQMGI